MTFDIENIKNDIILTYNRYKDLDRTNKHYNIQHELQIFAGKYNCFGDIEYSMEYVNKDNKRIRHGAINVVWLYNKYPLIAIEIDSYPREKSIKKLMNFDGAKIWLCYCNKEKELYYLIKEYDADRKIVYITPNIEI